MGMSDNVDEAITRRGHKGLTQENSFGGVTSFLRRTLSKDLTGVDVAVTGVPFDSAVSNRPGTRLGPRAIRQASALQPFDPPYGWDVDPLTEFNVIDFGDLGYDFADIAAFPQALEDHIAQILNAGAASLTLGGDHYITYPILKAHYAKYGPMALVQFDAHTDTWVDDSPARIDHGTFAYRAVKEGLIDPAKSVQCGIRVDIEDPLGINIMPARQVHLEGPQEIARKIKSIVGDHPVYLSFDIDGLDPAYAPGTGTPVWGGLTSAQAMIILRDLAGINVVGMDVVEVSPPYDSGEITAVAAAHVATDLLCLWAHNQKARS
jgi:agmatinase